MNIKKICLIIIIICSNIAFSGCSDVIDQLANYADKDNKYVVRIKNTVPSGESKSFGKAFDNFFAFPTWKYFDADTGESVVEFTVYCTYMDNKVKAKIQFILYNNGNKYKIHTLSFNDVPQNQLMLQTLLVKIFE